jgi:HD-like signal output (HDOD) protein
VLQVANSAYYQRGRNVQDLQSAVMKMGVRATGEVVVAVAGRSLFDPSVKAELELFKTRMRELYRSSMAIAFASREFSEQTQLGLPHQVFLAGMFHDIGHTLSLRALSALMIAGKVPKDLPPLAMDALLERTHIEMGAEAHRIWNLPPYLASLCAQHHDPEIPAWADRQDLHILRAVSGLNRLAMDPNDPSHAAETRQSLQALGIARAQAGALFERIVGHRELVKEMFPI